MMIPDGMIYMHKCISNNINNNPSHINPFVLDMHASGFVGFFAVHVEII